MRQRAPAAGPAVGYCGFRNVFGRFIVCPRPMLYCAPTQIASHHHHVHVAKGPCSIIYDSANDSVTHTHIKMCTPTHTHTCHIHRINTDSIYIYK